MAALHFLLLLALAPALVVADGQLRLLHRVYGKDIPRQPFTPRALVDPQSLTLTPVPSFHADLAHLLAAARPHKDALYQLALDPSGAGSSDEESLDISAVKACHLPAAAADYITLHLDSAGRPFHADYYLAGAGVPSSGACPSKKQLAALESQKRPESALLAPANTTLRVHRAAHPPLPELRTPPPLAADGKPVTPPPEKSFVQKYWLYIVIGLVGLLLAGGPPEEEGAPPAGGGGGGAGAGAGGARR